MINCNYTNNTEYNFFSSCCDGNLKIATSGTFSSNKIENILNCGGNSNSWVQLFVPEIVDIPEQKPDIETVVSVTSCVDIISQKVIKTPVPTGYTTTGGTFVPGSSIANSECTKLTGRKLIVEGIIKQKVVYTADMPEQSLHSACFDVPFSVFIIVPATTSLAQTFKISPYIEDIFACQLSERSIFKNTTIFIKASASC